MNPGEDNPNRSGLGLCLGASTISMVLVEHQRSQDRSTVPYERPKIVQTALRSHGGDPKRSLLEVFREIDLQIPHSIAVTGRKFRHFVNLSSISEPEAVEYAYRHTRPAGIHCPAVVSAGGETFMAYTLDGSGQITNVITGNKCASGTGEFFLQQLRRMNVTLEEAAHWTSTEDPYNVSGRCSVFCKSDCTHATNKGIPKSKVTAGLCRMMANKILELLKKVERRNIMVVGGTTRNRMMITFLQREIDGLIVPQEAPYFEALGAALWALDHPTRPLADLPSLIIEDKSSFDRLPPLGDFRDQVSFKSIETGRVRAGDTCILGLDVGSTTTKAVLMRSADNTFLASVYLRTNGDPVGASRRCYRSILEQVSESVDPARITIEGLGVCGSGRQIAGLHALTEGVVNEIIAHATAAVHFDPEVDTIFEIGGQDAKYTYITNGVPSDYAMNEACSAGTGSFLEESAHETLGVKMESIADIAVRGQNPPNFNDQCAAFISSDIKNAIHEGVNREDIVAGLVYSICMNYSNRVKGNRPVGNKVFMQGGVCYNRAVPLAMAALVGKPIIVPPEPGLMGAFGVALEVRNRIHSGLIQPQTFDLRSLVDRNVSYGRTFTCKGGKEKCDRGCRISVIELDGHKYPFGGACNRYENLRRNVHFNVKQLDLVRIRQQLVFERYGAPAVAGNVRQRGTVGFSKSFLVNSYYPLYSTFFSELGYAPIVPESFTRQGIDRRNAAFCYPAELAHGYFDALLSSDPAPDFIFLPHLRAVPSHNPSLKSQVCPLVQGETYYLRATFREKLAALAGRGTTVLAPVIDLSNGLEQAWKPLQETARKMGIRGKIVQDAFRTAVKRQTSCLQEMRSIGQRALLALSGHREQTAVVLLGRPYNAYAEEAHMGIPHKLASRGIAVIPLDFLPLEDTPSKRHMYWGMGQLIMKAARFTANHEQLFGVYITNFSCGPDSFLLGYFREVMGRKPSLTLELDSHTADAGLETRIEAFLDIVSAYRKLLASNRIVTRKKTFKAARTVTEKGIPRVITSGGESLAMTDPRVTLLLPSMGPIGSECLAAVFRGKGFNAYAYPPAGEAELKTGRANTSCKECLPLILTTGSLLNYIRGRKRPDEVLVYFMAGGGGPCRFGQYAIFMEDLVRRLEIPDVALLSLTSDNAYAGLDTDLQRRGWWAVLVSDVLEDIRSMLLANAVDPQSAMVEFERELNGIVKELSTGGDFEALLRRLAEAAERFARIPLKQPPESIPVIFLAGEIFVRRDSLSRQHLTERLAENGFAVICSPVSEWLRYADHLMATGHVDCQATLLERLKVSLRRRFKDRYERRIKDVLSRSGLVHAEPVDMKKIIGNAAAYLSPALGGEAILTIGSALKEVVSFACGVIAIGPFGCMPNRLSEAILSEMMTREEKLISDPDNEHLRVILADVDNLPFLAIESDGSPFPQIISAKLEAFCLRARRLHERIHTMN